MIDRASLAFALLVTMLAAAGSGEVLFALVSPNEELGGFFGYSVSEAGDVNGNGYHDVAVGAPAENPGSSPSSAGRAYVFDGYTGALLHTLFSPNEEEGGWFGQSVSGVGDVNGDGYDDVVVGASCESPGASPNNAGRAYVFDGETGNLLHALVSPNNEHSGHFGIDVSGAGDVNADGYDDVVIGAFGESPGSSPEDAGRAYVFDGQTGTLLHTLASPNQVESGFFGSSVSGVGDVNGDGYDDVVVGAYKEDPEPSPNSAGRAYIFDGYAGTLLHTLVSPNEEEYGYFGSSVSGAGDVNGDGYDDVVIGARSEDPGSSPNGSGRAYMFDGQTGKLLHGLVSPNEEEGGRFGYSVSGVGDINGDGYNEVAVGAYLEDPGSSPNGSGRAYMFDGQTGKLLYGLVSPNEEEGGRFGYSVSGVGDVNGDGYDDAVAGARREDPGSSPQDAGRAYVFSWMHLSSSLSGDASELEWTMWSPASEYWIYGADNHAYFIPAASPGYENRLAVVPSGSTAWSSPNGIGDPEHNWTYLVIAVDGSENELARSNRAGEHDFDCEIP